MKELAEEFLSARKRLAAAKEQLTICEQSLLHAQSALRCEMNARGINSIGLKREPGEVIVIEDVDAEHANLIVSSLGLLID